MSLEEKRNKLEDAVLSVQGQYLGSIKSNDKSGVAESLLQGNIQTKADDGGLKNLDEATQQRFTPIDFEFDPSISFDQSIGENLEETKTARR